MQRMLNLGWDDDTPRGIYPLPREVEMQLVAGRQSVFMSSPEVRHAWRELMEYKRRFDLAAANEWTVANGTVDGMM